MRLHGRFHFVLGCFEFFLQHIPFVILGKFVQAVTAAEQVLTYAQRFCQLDDIGADVLDLLAILGFNRDKAIGNQTAEV